MYIIIAIAVLGVLASSYYIRSSIEGTADSNETGQAEESIKPSGQTDEGATKFADPKEAGSMASQSGSQAPIVQISIENYQFTLKNITVKKGTMVTWTNRDAVAHTATIDDNSKAGPKSPLLEQGESYMYTFDTIGSFAYHCAPHPYMKGTVTVIE